MSSRAVGSCHTSAIQARPDTLTPQPPGLPASRLQRAEAVVVDFFCVYLFWISFGLVIDGLGQPSYSGLGIAVYFICVDLSLTAMFGLSPGRAAAGIRVIRVSDGGAPGLRRAALRIALVVVTGVPGVVYWDVASIVDYFLGTSFGSARLWWDALAGTAVVRSTRWGPAPILSRTELQNLRRLYGLGG
ncbi:MAG TPA: RDD family protein [Candidatus Dormibacteraeota bacterium]|nr:RDD family protein [Candidatus Dormibacteraeota bacterium]